MGLAGQIALCAETAGEGLQKFTDFFTLQNTAATVSVITARWLLALRVCDRRARHERHRPDATGRDDHRVQHPAGPVRAASGCPRWSRLPAAPRPTCGRARNSFARHCASTATNRRSFSRVTGSTGRCPRWIQLTRQPDRGRGAGQGSPRCWPTSRQRCAASCASNCYRRTARWTPSRPSSACIVGRSTGGCSSTACCYGDLLESVKHDVACQLLRDTDLQVQQIAESLHYSSAANFSTAFRRWTGSDPEPISGAQATLISRRAESPAQPAGRRRAGT